MRLTPKKTKDKLLTDPARINANKQGVVTDDQRGLLRLTSGLTFWFALGSVIVIIAIVVWAMKMQLATLPVKIPHIPVYFWIVLGVAIGSPLLYLGLKMVRSSRLRREIDSGNIVSGEGHVEWTGKRYRINASVSGLSSIYGPINALPGRYRFYILPESRYLLSADPLDSPQTSYVALTEILGHALGFTKDDLTANREGHFSPAQLAHLSSRNKNDKIAFVQGVGEKTFRYMTRSNIKSLIVNHERFDISTRAYEAIVDGETYGIYYLPNSKKILSVYLGDALNKSQAS